jgi:hypothetical protein
MWINNYPQMIAESPEKLLQQEKRLQPATDRQLSGVVSEKGVTRQERSA